MKKVIPIVLHKDKDPKLYFFLEQAMREAKPLYNSVLYGIRQMFFSFGKSDEELTEAEKEVRVWFDQARILSGKNFSYLDEQYIYYYAKIVYSPEMTPHLGAQTRGKVAKRAVEDFTNWQSAKADWKQNPEKYLGEPKMPHYKEEDITGFECGSNEGGLDDGVISFPKTKLKYKTTWLPEDFGKFKCLQIHPDPLGIRICLIYETKEEVLEQKPFKPAGMDLGVNVLAAAVCESGCFMIRGKALKSENQLYNKKTAQMRSQLDLNRNQNPKAGIPRTSKAMKRITEKRGRVMENALHKASKETVDWCCRQKVTHLIIGKNPQIKQNCDMGAVNNQNFVCLPLARFTEMVTYKAEQKGIQVILTEEAYTSKASLLDGDPLPSYEDADPEIQFSGKRIRRGLYRSKDGSLIHSDIQAAGNILRKVYPGTVIPKEALFNPEIVNLKTR